MAVPTTLGPRVIPQSGRPITSIDGGQVARAEAQSAEIIGGATRNLAQGLNRASDTAFRMELDQREKVDRTEYAQAQSLFLRDKIAADSGYDDDQDFQTIQKRYGEQVGKSAKAAASLIQNPMERAKFEQDASLEIARGSAAMSRLARGKEVNHGRAELTSTLDGNLDAATMSADSETRGGLLKASSIAIDSAIARGYVDELEGANMRRQYGNKYVAMQQAQLSDEFDSRSTDLISKAYQSGDVDGAVAGLNQLTASYAGSLQPDDLRKAYKENKDRLVTAALLSPNIKPTDALRMLNGTAPIDNPPIQSGVTPEFSASIESAEGTPDGRPSPAGALGVMQVLPSTAREIAGELGIPYDADKLQHDPAYGRQIGNAYAQKMLTRYGGNTMLASAAYNAGPGRVDDWILKFGDPRTGAISNGDFAQRIPIDETRNYVGRVINGMGLSQTQGPNLADQKAKGIVAPDAANFNTALSAEEEKGFRQWVVENKVPFDTEAAQSDYDMRGFWKALKAGDPRAESAVDPNDNLLHYPDYWKTPLHKTFSNESQWAGPNAPHWTPDDKLVSPEGNVLYDDKNPGPLNRSLVGDIDPQKVPALQEKLRARLRDEEATADATRRTQQDDAKGKFQSHLQSLAATGKGLNGFALEDYKQAFDPETYGSMERQQDNALQLNRWIGPLTTGTPADVARVLKESEPVPGSADYEQQVKNHDAVLQAAKERDTMIEKDPAGYVATYDPLARQAVANMQQGVADTRRPLAAAAIEQAQRRMGVPSEKIRAMPNAIAADYAGQVTTAPADKIGPMLDQIGATWGDNGVAQVANEKGVPPIVKLSAFADNPADALMRQRYAEAGRISDEELNKGLKERGYTPDDVTSAVAGVTEPLMQTMPVASARPYVDGMYQTVKYLVSKGMTPKEAAAAAWAPFDRTYTFRDTYRVPNQFDAGKVDDKLSEFIGNLKPDAVAVLGGSDPTLPASYAESQNLEDIKSDPVWVTNASDDGVILTRGDGDGLPGAPVMGKNGKRVELMFRDLTSPPVEASPPPAAPAGQPGGRIGIIPTAQAAEPPAKATLPKGGQSQAQPKPEPSMRATLERAGMFLWTDTKLRKEAASGNADAKAELESRGSY